MEAKSSTAAHCLDTLRQVLMCNVDTGVLGQVWYGEGHPEAFPDFNTKHTCKNYKDIRIWAEKNQVCDCMLCPLLASQLTRGMKGASRR